MGHFLDQSCKSSQKPLVISGIFSDCSKNPLVVSGFLVGNHSSTKTLKLVICH